jgi:hypothetical protein
VSGEGPTPGSPEPPDVGGPSDEEPGEVTRPSVPLEEMGGDPACWLGLVEDHRDDGLPAEPPP